MSRYMAVYKNKRLKTTSKKVCEACTKLVHKDIGLMAYPEQVKAAREMYKGNIVDMKTGEGKTLAVLLTVLFAVRDGHKVYVVTSNDYLSERDYDYSKSIFTQLGIESVFFRESIGGTDKAYADADVIYATGQTLIFDYLRGIKADYDFVIIDEIDYILVECANHDFSVSYNEQKVRMPEDAFKMCKSIVDMLTVTKKKGTDKKEDILFDKQYQADVILDYTTRSAHITIAGYEKLEQIFGNLEENMMYVEFIQATLLVKYFYLRDVHYIVQDGKILIINNSSGRVHVGGSNDICIQTAIEVKEKVQVTPKTLLHNTCSYPVFFSVFKTLSGISGTSSYVPFDFDIIYQKEVKKIREHFRNKRKEIYEYFRCEKGRCEYLYERVKEGLGPFLIVTDSDMRSKMMQELLSPIANKTVMILDNTTLEDEKILLEKIKAENAVLISSKIVGRGTDIDLPEQFTDGLTVILTVRMFSERAERQIIGRTGRNGKKGTCYVLTCFEDKLFDLEYKKRKLPTEKNVKILQSRYEQKMFETRKHIYIRSKLFFDQDIAIRQRLTEFDSYESMEKFLRKYNLMTDNLSKRFQMAKEKNYKFLEIHTTILQKAYDTIRPYFQQQFLQYNDMMASSLYTTEGFQMRCKEYVSQGRVIIADCIDFLMKQLTKDAKI